MNIFVLRAVFLCLSIVASLPALAQEHGTKPQPAKQRYAIVLKLVPRLLDDANWTDADNRKLGEHLLRLKRLKDSGTVALAGRTLAPGDEAFSIVIMETESEAEARAVMDEDPAVKAGMMTAQMYPFFVQFSRPIQGQ